MRSKGKRRLDGSCLPPLAIALACLGCAAKGKLAPLPSAPRDPGPAIAVARRVVGSLREASRIPGLSVAVGLDRSIVWSEAFGQSDVERAVPATPSTRFRIASLSKLLTVAALARLHEQGRIDLDAPISRYVPSWPDKGHVITARQLAGHLGGIRGYQEEDFESGIESRRYGSVTDALDIFRDDPLEAPPGTVFHYSSYGYTLLSAAMEAVSGEDFLDLVRTEVLEPLGMRRTEANRPDVLPEDMTTLYARDEKGRVVPVPNLAPSYKWAAGGFVSTTEDMVRFGLAHLHAGFLRQETLQMLFTSQRTTDGIETGVGFGWMNTVDPFGRQVLFHNGSQAGSRSILLVYPKERLVVAVLTNLTGAPRLAEGTAMGVAEMFLHAATSAGPSPSAPDAVPGPYRYTVGSGNRASTGSVEIEPGGAGYRGIVTRTSKAGPPRLHLELLRAPAGGLCGILAAPEGLILLDLKAAPGGFDGRFVLQAGVHPTTLPVRLERETREAADSRSRGSS